MKRKDVQRLAAELVDGIEQLRRDLALRDAQVQQLTAEVERLTAEVERLRRLRDSDGVARLRDADEAWLALAEVKRLRTALALAVGELSTRGPYVRASPDELMQHFIHRAVLTREATR